MELAQRKAEREEIHKNNILILFFMAQVKY